MPPKRRNFHICPYCHASYHNKDMADRCIKTSLCRIFNTPSPERLNALTMQVGVAAVIEFVIHPLGQRHEDVRDTTQTIESAIVKLYHDFALLRCNTKFIDAIGHQIADALSKIWPASEETNAIHMLAVAGALVIEMRQELQHFWNENPNMQAPAIWQEIEKELDALFEHFNPDLTENYVYADRIPDAVEQLQSVIWPKTTTTPKDALRLYLVGNRFWVTAHSKTEARALVSARHGITKVGVEEISPTEILENGEPASTLIALADSRCDIIGETK